MLLLCVKTPDDGQRNCLKYVEFYSKNKFKKLVYLVGFIIRIIQHIFAGLYINVLFNLLAPELFFFILAHPVYKM